MANASRPGGGGVRELAPKRSWGKVLFKASIVLVLMVIGSHWAWGKFAGARFERELARYRAAGEAIDPADFVEAEPPVELNAADDLIAAGQLVDSNSKTWRKFYRISPALPLDEKEMLVIGNVLNASRDALRRLDAAMPKPRVHWGQTYQSPVALSNQRPWYNGRQLPGMLRAAALRSHQLGDDRDALARIRQILFIARAIDRDPSLSSHAEAGGVCADACDAILQIAPDLAADRGWSAAEIRALITDLSDDARDRQALVRALQGERMQACDFVRAYAAGHSELMSYCHVADLETQAQRIVILPFALNDGPVVLAHTGRLIDAARRAPDWPAMRSSAPDLDRPAEVSESPCLHSLTSVIMPHFERRLQAHFHAIAEQRLTATALAIRLYGLEHDGRVPADLEDLVPDYLATLPLDPMAAGGRRLRLVSSPTDPLLYSVGDDGTDDGGDTRPTHGNSQVNSFNMDWDSADAVVHLLRQPRIRADLDD